MEIKLKYGQGYKTLSLPDRAEIVFLAPSPHPTLTDLEHAVKQALDSPLEAARLEDRPPPRRVAIALPDESRPVPFKAILPVVLRRLFNAYSNLEPEDISIIIGGGLHPRMGSDRARLWVPPEVSLECRMVIHDPHLSPLTDLGRTSRGTPVAINTEYSQADLKMVIGQIDPHQFVGFTGGAKGVAIGCASPATIEHNHSLMFQDGAEAGRLDGNPVREDLNDIGRLAGVDLAVNVVLDPDKRAVGLWAGEPMAVLRRGAQTCARVYGVAISEQYDLAVASCGGYPKDICLYQAQKGLNLASRAVKPGGGILLLASCDQGVGDQVYFDYVSRFDSCREAMEDFRRGGFRMGAHKAYLFGRTLSRYEVAIESEMSAEDLRRCYLAPRPAQETLDRWLAERPGRPRVAVVPNANTTYFYRAEGNGD
ncbi:MAG: nickel-dependent lactate racemase [Thermodesulfobacteriota bacterium]